MREILFKAKRLDNGEWVEGSCVNVPNKHFYIFTGKLDISNGYLDFEKYSVDPETICQFTGLHDKNGNKIWENDIIKSGVNLFVSYSEKFASWRLTKDGWYYSHFFGEACDPKDCEVVGNKFDNPELLKNGVNK